MATALTTNTRLPQLIGLPWPKPGIGVCHWTLIPFSTSQSVGTPAPSITPELEGPRKDGHSRLAAVVAADRGAPAGGATRGAAGAAAAVLAGGRAAAVRANTSERPPSVSVSSGGGSGPAWRVATTLWSIERRRIKSIGSRLTGSRPARSRTT